MTKIRIIIHIQSDAIARDITSLLSFAPVLKRRFKRLNAFIGLTFKRKDKVGERQESTAQRILREQLSEDNFIEDMVQQYCLNCAKPLCLTSRRANPSTVKKYCNGKCRSSYHNKLRKQL